MDLVSEDGLNLTGTLGLKDAAELQISSENIFGKEVKEFAEILSEEDKWRIWIEKGGRAFNGEFGKVKRFVIGVPLNAEEPIKTGGFNPQKRTWRSGAFLGKWGGRTEGWGIYAGTNCVQAIRDYGEGSCAAIVDVAMGNELTPNSDQIFRVIDKTREWVMWSWGAFIGAVDLAVLGFKYNPDSFVWATIFGGVAAVFLKSKLLDAYYANFKADTVQFTPNLVGAAISASLRIKEEKNPFLLLKIGQRSGKWELIRDPRRIRVVGFIHSPEDAYQYTQGLLEEN